MRIILDTNIICADYHMNGNAFRVFLSSIPRLGVSVYVPQVVLDEAINNYKKDLDRIVISYQQLSRTWRRITSKELEHNKCFSEVDKEIVEYKNYINKKLKSVDAKVLPYPSISHKIVVRRALEKKYPFRTDDRGYRDTLIWETVLKLCKEKGSKVYFVTNNRRDFGEGPRPHSDLLNDLMRIGCSTDILTIVCSLEDLNKDFFFPHLKRLDEMILQFSKDEVSEFSLEGWVQFGLSDLLREDFIGAALLGLEEGHSHTWPSTILEIESIEVDDVRLLPSGDLLVSATADIKTEVAVDGDLEAYYMYEDVRDLWGNKPPEENETAWIPVHASVSFSLVLEKETFEILSAEVDGVCGGGIEIITKPHPRRTK